MSGVHLFACSPFWPQDSGRRVPLQLQGPQTKRMRQHTTRHFLSPPFRSPGLWSSLRGWLPELSGSGTSVFPSFSLGPEVTPFPNPKGRQCWRGRCAGETELLMKFISHTRYQTEDCWLSLSEGLGKDIWLSNVLLLEHTAVGSFLSHLSFKVTGTLEIIYPPWFSL